MSMGSWSSFTTQARGTSQWVLFLSGSYEMVEMTVPITKPSGAWTLNHSQYPNLGIDKREMRLRGLIGNRGVFFRVVLRVSCRGSWLGQGWCVFGVGSHQPPDLMIWPLRRHISLHLGGKSTTSFFSDHHYLQSGQLVLRCCWSMRSGTLCFNLSLGPTLISQFHPTSSYCAKDYSSKTHHLPLWKYADGRPRYLRAKPTRLLPGLGDLGSFVQGLFIFPSAWSPILPSLLDEKRRDPWLYGEMTRG